MASKGKKMEREPDVLVCIDIGTCESKCVLKLRDQQHPVIVDQYPDNDSQQQTVPTAMSYVEGAPMAWGYTAVQRGLTLPDKAEWYSQIKSGFPSSRLSDVNGSGKDRPSMSLYRDFLRCLYSFLREFWVKHSPSRDRPWEEINLKFVFGVPAAGDPKAATAAIIRAARQAGYDRHPGGATFAEGVFTESEAAATFALHGPHDRRNFTVGDAALVVDIGGSTSDICLFATRACVKEGRKGAGSQDESFVQEMDRLEAVSGDSIGGAFIDKSLRESLGTALSLSGVENGRQLAMVLAHRKDFSALKKMVSGDLENPTRGVMLQIRADGRPVARQSAAGYQGYDGIQVLDARAVYINGERLEKEFDSQLKLVREQIDAAIEILFARSELYALRATKGGAAASSTAARSGENLGLILLSGGLGGAPRTKQWLERALAQDRESQVHANTPRIGVAVCSEPQLCVALGLARLYQRRLEQEAMATTPWGKAFVRWLAGK